MWPEHPLRIGYIQSAARQCWSEGMEGGDDFLKFGMPSSGCDSHLTKVEPDG